MKLFKTLSLGAIAAATTATSVLAHVSLSTPAAPQDSAFVVTLQVPHGCDGKPTTEIQIKLPEGFISAKPQQKAGWDIEIIKGDYAKTYESHGKEITSGPREIRWKNGNLSDDYYDTFSISGTFSGIAAGTAVPFATTQLCGSDGSAVWDEIAADGADPHSLDHPAPLLHIVAAQEGEHHDHDMGAMATGGEMAPVRLGDLELSAGSVKAMLPGQPVGGGFITVHNAGTADDTLLSVSSPEAGRVELHEMSMQNDIMKMRKLDAGIPVPAGDTVALKAGGLHMMFFEVKHPFAAGGAVPVTLTFEKAGKVDAVLPVVAAGKK